MFRLKFFNLVTGIFKAWLCYFRTVSLNSWKFYVLAAIFGFGMLFFTLFWQSKTQVIYDLVTIQTHLPEGYSDFEKFNVAISGHLDCPDNFKKDSLSIRFERTNVKRRFTKSMGNQSDLDAKLFLYGELIGRRGREELSMTVVNYLIVSDSQDVGN